MLVDKDTYLKIINSKPDKEFLDKCKEASELFEHKNDLNLSSEDIQFLKDLSYELNTQDHVGQANPRFWVIMDTKKVYGYDKEYRGYDGYEVIHDGETVADNLDDLLEYLDDIGMEIEITDDGLVKVEGYRCTKDVESIIDLINDALRYNFELVGYVEEEYIVQDTMFLTLREAQDHIKRNYYHYSDKVHPYAMTAWRSPQVDKLIKILSKINPKE